jgi:hypothetical protein
MIEAISRTHTTRGDAKKPWKAFAVPKRFHPFSKGSESPRIICGTPVMKSGML